MCVLNRYTNTNVMSTSAVIRGLNIVKHSHDAWRAGKIMKKLLKIKKMLNKLYHEKCYIVCIEVKVCMSHIIASPS